MIKAENYGFSWLDLTLPFECELHWCRPRGEMRKNRYRVLLHHSEPSFSMSSSEEVRRFHGCFDLILTNQTPLLDLPNAKFMVFGSSWVSGQGRPSEFSLSFLYSNGYGNESKYSGYGLRREVWNRRHEIKIPLRFWTGIRRPPSNIWDHNPLPVDSKEVLFRSMFSVAIENTREDDYFTEKLIDPFVSCVVPLYIGCTNIEKYFFEEGFYCLDSVDQLIAVANGLSPEDYVRKKSLIEFNKRQGESYKDWDGRLKAVILEERAKSLA